MSMSALAMGGAGPAVRPPRCAVLALALALVSAGCVPVGGDVYDDVALFDKPWAYWRLVPARGNATAVIADSSQRSVRACRRRERWRCSAQAVGAAGPAHCQCPAVPSHAARRGREAHTTRAGAAGAAGAACTCCGQG